MRLVTSKVSLRSGKKGTIREFPQRLHVLLSTDHKDSRSGLSAGARERIASRGSTAPEDEISDSRIGSKQHQQPSYPYLRSAFPHKDLETRNPKNPLQDRRFRVLHADPRPNEAKSRG